MEAVRNLDIWKRACQLSTDLYDTTSSYTVNSFKDQIVRAGLSVLINITEGYGHDNVREQIQHLNIAKGSCGEVWTQLMIGRSAGLISPNDYAKLEMESSEISRVLWDDIRQLQMEQENAFVTGT